MKILKKIFGAHAKALLLYILVYALVSIMVERIDFFTELVSYVSANVTFVFSGTVVLSLVIFCLFFLLYYFVAPYRQNLLDFFGVSCLVIIVFSTLMMIIISIYEVVFGKCTDMCGLGTYFLWRFLVVAIIMAWFLNLSYAIAWKATHNRKRVSFKNPEIGD